MAGLRGSSWGLGLAVGLSLGKVDVLLSASLEVTVYEGRADTTQGMSSLRRYSQWLGAWAHITCANDSVDDAPSYSLLSVA